MTNNISARKQSKPVCAMCGLCCQLFLINLNKGEYYSGEYSTVFDDIEIFTDFSKACEYGANLLKKQANDSCIYLKADKCCFYLKHAKLFILEYKKDIIIKKEIRWKKDKKK